LRHPVLALRSRVIALNRMHAMLTFAAPNAPSLPLHVVTKEGLGDWLAARPKTEQAWLAACGFEAGLGELRLLPAPDGAIAGAVFGYGDARARARGRFHLARAAAGLPAGNWHLEATLDPDDLDEAALGWLLAGYRFDRYHKGKAATAHLKAPAGVDAARTEAIAAGEALTRDLINTPASDMGPAELEDAFVALANRFGAQATVIRGDDLLARNLPMIHAVGRASMRAPRLLDMRWGTSGPQLTLVGKGVCFDTGGLDIKPSAGMLLMKKDMGGAATVLGLAQTIMALGLGIRLRVLVPAVENAISGNAMRPRDILTSRKGLTVEINNTDAEGRLVLADALALADEEKPDVIVSMATLTGAARVAVGPDLAPYYTDDAQKAQAVERAAARVRDPVWRMPFWAPYDPLIEPGIADLDNAPAGGFAGSITAALFLRRFVENAPYMHFDIYGHQPTDAPARPKGGVGQGARALLQALPEMLGL
jgi:leucyl aminopeptidase